MVLVENFYKEHLYIYAFIEHFIALIFPRKVLYVLDKALLRVLYGQHSTNFAECYICLSTNLFGCIAQAKDSALSGIEDI